MSFIQIWILHIHQRTMSWFTFLFSNRTFTIFSRISFMIYTIKYQWKTNSLSICVINTYLANLNVKFAFLWMRLGSIVYHKALPLLVAYVWIQRYKCILSIYKTHSVVISRLIEQVTSVQGQKEF